MEATPAFTNWMIAMPNPNAYKCLIAVIAFAFSMQIAVPAYADKTDPDLIPPDVTLITNPSASTATSAAAAAAPGLADSAAPAAAATAAAGAVGSAGPQGLNLQAGYAIPKTGKVTAGIMKPPGTPFGAYTPRPPAPGASAGDEPQPTNKSLYQGSGNPVDANKPDPIATIETSKGEIQIRLFRQLAPKTVDNFIDLCGRGFYNGLTFHRVEPGFCIQGGDPNGNGTGVFIDPQAHISRFLPLEVTPKLKHNGPGVVAMARMQSQDSGSCQFYITLGAQPSLDMQYAVFGGVISGMSVVNNIQKGDKIVSASVREQ
jgi:peptidyl-prolyl cis-trans isomerase B (cyclophilin B)